MDFNTIALVISFFSVIIASWAAFAATQTAKQARNSVTSSIILEISKLYSSDEISKGV
jgi:ABC-type spermidine/putrescine transport system permease subunit II